MAFTTAITIATQRRQASLGRLLAALADEYGSQSEVGLVVIDNDPLGSARDVVERARRHFAGSVTYRLEPREGYASVRNAAIAATSPFDYTAFIDDDEIPEPGWLHDLHDARERFGADVVAGAVITDFPLGTPEWLIRSGVMDSDQPSLATGAALPWCATNNTLVANRVFQGVPEGFDQRFDKTGGEDTHFFSRARLAGFRIVWTNEARVHEPIPPRRTRPSWILRRAARSGNNKALIAIGVVRRPGAVALRASKAIGMVLMGMLSVSVGAIRYDRARMLRGMQRCAEGAGTIAGFCGIRLA